MRERESVGGGRDSVICYDYSNRALCNYNDEVFSYCAEKDLGRPFVSTLLQCFEELGLGRGVTRLSGGGKEEEE